MNILRSIAPLAFLVACSAGGPGTDQQAHQRGDNHGGMKNQPQASCIISRFELRNELRTLLIEQVAFTRFAAIEMIANLPQSSFTLDRLMLNQQRLVDALQPFFGSSFSAQLLPLLQQQVQGIQAFIVAARSGDVTITRAAMDANGRQIADLFASVNIDIRSMIQVSIDTMVTEVMSRTSGNFQGEIVAFDTVILHVMEMADTLTVRITALFPNLVSTKDNAVCCDTNVVTREDLRIVMRRLFAEQLVMARIVLLESFGVCNTSLADLQLTIARFVQLQVEIVDQMRPFLGNSTSDQLAVVFKAQVQLFADYVVAVRSNDTQQIATARAAIQVNIDSMVQLFQGSNLAVEQLKVTLRAQLDLFVTLVNDQMSGNYAGVVTTFDDLVINALAISDALSSAIARQFPE